MLTFYWHLILFVNNNSCLNIFFSLPNNFFQAKTILRHIWWSDKSLDRYAEEWIRSGNVHGYLAKEHWSISSVVKFICVAMETYIKCCRIFKTWFLNNFYPKILTKLSSRKFLWKKDVVFTKVEELSRQPFYWWFIDNSSVNTLTHVFPFQNTWKSAKSAFAKFDCTW